MKALVLEEYSKLVYKDVPQPEVGDDDVLVRIKACGICGSDVHGFDGSSGRRHPPLIMGHEASGVVEQCGSKVSAWNTGDRVTFDSTVFSPDDWYTLNGRYNLSEGREVIGVSPGDYKRHGAFAEYIAVPQRVLHRIPDSVTFEQAAMVEPIAVALHAVNQAKVKVGDSCVVVGVGTIGILILNILQVAGAGLVAAIDLNPANRDRASNNGADLVFDPNDPTLFDTLRAATSGRGADLAFEAVGIDPTVNLALKSLRKGGECVLVGNLSPTVSVPLQHVVTGELILKGSCGIRGEYPTALRLIEQGKIDVSQYIAQVAPLSEGADWFDRLYNEKVSGKVILVP